MQAELGATTLVERLQGCVGPAHVLADTEVTELYGQDIWHTGATPLAVVQPATREEVAAVVQAAADAGCAVVPRGGGMSYTRGYTTEQAAIAICSSRMNRIVEINELDMYVTVQAGVTWADLHQALQARGLRTPYWGPLSGRYATVGGSVSQNSIFWGGSRHGSAADSVTGVEVVLASGEVLHTGSAARREGSSFFRHHGPDLTGLFTCDCGALGIKTAITLRLLPDNCAREFLSFDFADHNGLLAAMTDISRQDLASECFGFDPLLTRMRAQRDSLMSDTRTLAKVMGNAGSVKQALKDAASIVASGRRFMHDLGWPLHVIVEERTEQAAREVAARVRAIGEQHGGTAVADSIPRIMRANPFGPVNNMIGPGGERWVPVHGLLPLSQAAAATEAVLDIFAARHEQIESHGIQCGFLYNSVGGHCIAVEPLFFWPDQMQALHRASVEAEFYQRVPKLPAHPATRSLVAQLRQQIADKLGELGAAHLQLGRSYNYFATLEPAAQQLIGQLKRQLDPAHIINPGVLGIPEEITL